MSAFAPHFAVLKGEGLRYALTGHTARFTVTTRDHYKQEVTLCFGIVSVSFVHHLNFNVDANVFFRFSCALVDCLCTLSFMDRKKQLHVSLTMVMAPMSLNIRSAFSNPNYTFDRF